VRGRRCPCDQLLEHRVCGQCTLHCVCKEKGDRSDPGQYRKGTRFNPDKEKYFDEHPEIARLYREKIPESEFYRHLPPGRRG
jgi:hypothetical protein